MSAGVLAIIRMDFSATLMVRDAHPTMLHSKKQWVAKVPSPLSCWRELWRGELNQLVPQ
jgi:hypothetical protein